jgi:hypothetical protein
MSAWYVQIGDKNGNEMIAPSGKPQCLWFPVAKFTCEADAFAYVRKHFTGITPLKAYQSDEERMVRPVPSQWYLYGTNRMKLEIEAGLRPHSDYLQPPIDLESLNPQTRKGKSLWRKRILS